MAHVDAYENIDAYDTAQKMEFPIKDFFTECDQIRNFLRIWSHLLNNLQWKTSFFWAYDVTRTCSMIRLVARFLN